jgi:hypothetical protein
MRWENIGFRLESVWVESDIDDEVLGKTSHRGAMHKRVCYHKEVLLYLIEGISSAHTGGGFLT